MNKIYRVILSLVLISLVTACYSNRDLIPKQDVVIQEVEQGFKLEFRSKVDILFVIDSSGSMGPYQNSLSLNMDAFIQSMQENKILDYQIAITTSDSSGFGTTAGRLIGSVPIVSKKTAGGLLALQKNIKAVGTNGDATESFFEPIAAAVGSQSSLNPTFVRKDAFLVIILVTDSFDQSRLIGGQAVFDDLINNLKGGDSTLLLGYGVMAYPEYFGDSCQREEMPPENLFDFMFLFNNSNDPSVGGGVKTPTNDPNVPPQYNDLKNVFSLCDPLFGFKVASIGKDIEERISAKIPLHARPIDGTIVIKYGTQVIDQKWWKYDIRTNSIIIDPLIQLDENQVDPEFVITMDEADPLETIGDPRFKPTKK